MQAQSYTMPSGSGSADYTTCSGTFYDAGGVNGGHGTNQNSSITFHPSTQGMSVRLVFSVFRVGTGATMTIYDGPDNTANIIGEYDRYISPLGIEIVATANNPTGEMTIEFVSGASAEEGWVAAVSCRAPCQPYTISIDEERTTKPMVDDMYFNVCQNDQVTFCATGDYPQSGQLYEQSDANVTFSWQFGADATPQNGQCCTKVFNEVHGYEFYLTAHDAQNCYPSAIFKGRVRVAGDPVQNVTNLPDVCSGTILPIIMDTTNVAMIEIDPVSDYTSGSLNVADLTFLPDGNSVSYTSELTYTVFEPGQTLTNINDLLGICLDMEHSYLGDLSIRITCPSGQSCLLKAYGSPTVSGGIATSGSTGGGGIHLGFAPDPSSGTPCYTTPGEPLTYCFTPQSTTPMGNNGPTTSVTYTDPCGNTDTWQQLNAGDYGSYENMNVLLGCQLNGAWTITVTDNISLDNGYIFSWGLSLNPNLIPGGWGYDVGIEDVYWSGENLTPNPESDHIFEGSLTTDDPGNFIYQITIVDEYGCEYTRDVPLNVIQTPEPHLPELLNICTGTETATLDPAFDYIGPASLISYQWSTGETAPIIYVSDTGYYYVNVTTYNADHSLACSTPDTVYVDISPMPVADFEATSLSGCAPLNLQLVPQCSFVDGLSHPEITMFYNWVVTNENNTVVFTSAEASPMLSLDVGGVYSVQLTVRTDAGCTDSKTREEYLTVYPQPHANFIYNLVAYGIEAGGTYNFVNTTDISAFNLGDNLVWHWNYGDEQTSNDFEGPHEYINSGIYTITLSVNTAFGCSDETSQRIRIPTPYYFYVPNAFSPNGDGKNDIFKPYGFGFNAEKYEFMVFERTGRLVFRTDNYEQGWNGMDNGKRIAYGAYVYVIRTEDMDGEPKEYTGTVTVIR